MDKQGNNENSNFNQRRLFGNENNPKEASESDTEESSTNHTTEDTASSEDSTAKTTTLLAKGAAVAAEAGLAAAYIANTRIKAEDGILSSDTHLGPISDAAYIGASNGDYVQGQSRSFKLGGISSSQSKQHHFGRNGAGTTESSGWDIGNIGCHNTTHEGFGEKHNLYNYRTEGDIFGKKYKFGFNVPTPDTGKMARDIRNAASTVSDFFEDTGSDIVEGVEKAAKHAGPAVTHSAHVVGRFFNKAGPDIVKGAGQAVKVAGKVGKHVGPAVISAAKTVGPVVKEGVKLAASLSK